MPLDLTLNGELLNYELQGKNKNENGKPTISVCQNVQE